MRISLLLDSELDGRDNPRLIDRLEEDESLKEAWARYNLVGDVMRGPGRYVASRDFAAKVSAAIAEEPTVLAPKTASHKSTARRRAANLALAASLAAVAVLVGRSLNDHAEALQTAATQRQSASELALNATEGLENQAEAQFNDYLTMHNETAYMAGSAGVMPYVRLAGIRAGR
ncbi:MAG: sigma-E factor negative regulatory protein [Methylococcaceae bacterium]|nr:sigma-E factor negative regulatory protein [Methylococcaceae bacterium]